MDEKFLKAFKTYYSIVEDACNLLIDYIEKKEQITVLNKFDLYDYLHRCHRFEFNINDKKYFFHGFGCTVYENDTPIIHWDFGCRSWWCGILPFKMSETLKSFLFEDVDYYDSNFVKQKCEQYLSKKIMYNYKGQYYINLLKLKTIKIDFPNNYDRVVIEYKGITRAFSKCKSIDKFIRKSNVIYEGISELKNNYILVFYNKDIEVARIPYNDIAYQDSAVKIMNGEIIRPHITEKWKKE